jgi:hypothetical protein
MTKFLDAWFNIIALSVDTAPSKTEVFWRRGISEDGRTFWPSTYVWFEGKLERTLQVHTHAINIHIVKHESSGLAVRTQPLRKIHM